MEQQHPENATLAPGWSCELSTKEHRYYFFNAKAKLSVWNLEDIEKFQNDESQGNLLLQNLNQNTEQTDVYVPPPVRRTEIQSSPDGPHTSLNSNLMSIGRPLSYQKNLPAPSAIPGPPPRPKGLPEPILRLPEPMKRLPNVGAAGERPGQAFTRPVGPRTPYQAIGRLANSVPGPRFQGTPRTGPANSVPGPRFLGTPIRFPGSSITPPPGYQRGRPLIVGPLNRHPPPRQPIQQHTYQQRGRMNRHLVQLRLGDPPLGVQGQDISRRTEGYDNRPDIQHRQSFQSRPKTLAGEQDQVADESDSDEDEDGKRRRRDKFKCERRVLPGRDLAKVEEKTVNRSSRHSIKARLGVPSSSGGKNETFEESLQKAKHSLHRLTDEESLKFDTIINSKKRKGSETAIRQETKENPELLTTALIPKGAVKRNVENNRLPADSETTNKISKHMSVPKKPKVREEEENFDTDLHLDVSEDSRFSEDDLMFMDEDELQTRKDLSEKYDEVDQPEDDLVLVLDQDTEDDSVLPIENITQAPVTQGYDTSGDSGTCTVEQRTHDASSNDLEHTPKESGNDLPTKQRKAEKFAVLKKKRSQTGLWGEQQLENIKLSAEVWKKEGTVYKIPKAENNPAIPETIDTKSSNSDYNNKKHRYETRKVYGYSEFEPVDYGRGLVDPSSPFFFHEVAIKSHFEGGLEDRGDRTPERPSTPEHAESEEELQKFSPLCTSSPSFNTSLDSSYSENNQETEDYALNESLVLALDPPSIEENLNTDSQAVSTLSSISDAIKNLQEEPIVNHQQTTEARKDLGEKVDVGATLTAREREIEEREEILREGMDLRTLEQAINNIRSRTADPDISFRSSTMDPMPNSVIVDTSPLFSCLNLLESIKCREDYSVLIPSVVVKDIKCLAQNKDIRIKVHAERIMDWIKEHFDGPFEDPRAVAYTLVGLVHRELVWQLARLAPGSTILTSDKDMLKESGKFKTLCGDGENILEVLEHRAEILNELREAEAEKITITLREESRNLLEVVLVSEMEKFYDKDWKKVIKVAPAEARPFWNLDQMFSAIEKHFEAVFSVFYPFKGSTLLKCCQRFKTLLDKQTKLPKKVDRMIPIILELCDIVALREQLPRSLLFDKSLHQLAVEIKELMIQMKEKWEEGTDLCVDEVGVSNEISAKVAEFIMQNSPSPTLNLGLEELYQQDKEVSEEKNSSETAGYNEVSQEEDDEEEDDDEEEEGGPGRLLLQHVWHISHVVTFGLCDALGVAHDLEPQDPSYTFQSRKEAEKYAPIFLENIERVRNEYLSVVRKLVKSEAIETTEVQSLLSLLTSFKSTNNIRDESREWESTPILGDQEFYQYLQDEEAEVLAAGGSQIEHILLNLRKCEAGSGGQ